MEFVSIPISIVSLAVSLGTFWLAFIDRGQLKMTRPTIVFFGYDMVPRATPKVFLRTLLYSTANRGQVVEGMFVKVGYGGSEQVFSFWGYGETEKLTPGSGLHVSKTGFSANHHFVLSVHETEYRFKPGDYDINVFASVVGRKAAIHLSTIRVTLKPDLVQHWHAVKGCCSNAGSAANTKGIRDMTNPMGLPTECRRPVPPAIFRGLWRRHSAHHRRLRPASSTPWHARLLGVGPKLDVARLRAVRGRAVARQCDKD